MTPEKARLEERRLRIELLIAMADRESKRIERTIRRSDERVARAEAVLRRAGLLRS